MVNEMKETNAGEALEKVIEERRNSALWRILFKWHGIDVFKPENAKYYNKEYLKDLKKARDEYEEK